MISAADFALVLGLLGQQGQDDLTWANGCCPPESPEEFALEAIYVICNSGMKNNIARQIYNRVRDALLSGQSASVAFGHKGKATAIDRIWTRRQRFFDDYNAASDKVAFCGSMPWIGEITKFHLAKNFGADVAKPDVHLQRLADREGVSAQALCDRLATETGHRAAAIDVILWRACANGIINSRTGQIEGGGREP